MRKVLLDLVAQNQSAFVENMSIMENILICQDLLKHYNRKNAFPRCLMKIALREAYDTLNWYFIGEVLEGLVFQGNLKAG